ncbi:hypothetical protein GF314_05920 [bacterium]|nr:hypothetical protein [bacterium]
MIHLRGISTVAPVAGLVCTLILVALTGGGCGRAPAVDTDVVVEPPSGLFVDWDRLDWSVDRFILSNVREYMRVESRRSPTPLQDYLEAVTYDAPWDSLSLVAYLGLSADERAARRRDGASAHRRARRALVGTITYYRNVGEQGYVPNLPKIEIALPPVGAETAVTSAIRHLITATGTDPSNVGAWRDLSYLTGIVGDRPRQQRALAACLAALEQSPAEIASSTDARRVRRDVLLDLAWLARDLDQPAVTIAYLDHLQPWLDTVCPERAGRRYEAGVLRGLALAEQGEWLAAVTQARDLPRIEVTTRTLAGGSARNDLRWTLTAPHFMTLGFNRGAWPRQSSDFGRRWIKALAGSVAGDGSHTLWLLGPPATHLEFPPRLSYRYWQDQGRIYARAGRHETARNCYDWAAMYHPYGPFFPMQGRDGRPLSASQGYFVGYGRFYVCGDRKAYDRDAAELSATVGSRTAASAPN